MTNTPQPNPPKRYRRILAWYCKEEILESIEGDINEEFYDIYKKKGKRRANWYYLTQTIGFFRPFALRLFKQNTMLNMNMLYNYLIVGLRNLKSDVLNTSLSVLGLFFALLCSMVVFQVSRFEVSYDQFHENSESVYRVIYDENKNPNSSRIIPTVGPPLGPAIMEYYPEVKDAVRLRYARPSVVSHEDKRFNEDGIFYVDPSFFRIFTFELLKGSTKTVLSKPNNVVLTEEIAHKYFGDADPMGKTIMFNDDIPYTISGIVKSLPQNSHIKFDILLPFESFKVPFGYPVTLDDWGWISFYTYIQLEKGVNANELEAKLPVFASTHFPENRTDYFDYKLQPLNEIYFGSLHSENMESGTISYIYGLISVGVMLVLLASFNFINIYIAKSVTRAKESGVRKTLGATIKSLWLRYLLEPMLIVFGAYLLAIFLLPTTLDFVNIGLGTRVPLESDQLIELTLIFLGFSLFLGTLAGIYPAVIMSSYKTSTIAKGRFKSSKEGLRLRQALLVIQFVITTLLLGGNLIVSEQMSYIQNKDLGFDKDELVYFEVPGYIQERYFDALSSSFLKIPEIEGVVVGGSLMDGRGGSVPITAEGFEESKPVTIESVKHDYFKTMGIDMVSGREFSKDYPNDSTDGIILNEAAAKLFEWSPEEAIGKKMVVSDIMQGRVLGVTKDYHLRSLHDPIEPVVIYFPRDLNTIIYARISSEADFIPLVENIEKRWMEIIPDVPFNFDFLSSHINQQYKSDIEFSKLITYLTYLILIIASIGLYGLMAIMNRQMEQEMSIRKVFGAPVNSIIYTFSKPFVKLILMANIVAWPLVFLLSREWLTAFNYKSDLTWHVFAFPVFLTLGIAAITLALQIARVSKVNPTQTLRYE